MSPARTLPALLLALCAAALRLPSRAHSGEESGSQPAITAEELRDHVRRLASDEWKGRSAGSPEEILATDFIAGTLASFGLEPAGEGETWFQEVPMAAGFQVDPSSSFQLLDDGAPAFALDRDFRPLSVSMSGKVEDQLVFLGYGITAPELGYDDFPRVETKGRIAVIFRSFSR